MKCFMLCSMAALLGCFTTVTCGAKELPNGYVGFTHILVSQDEGASIQTPSLNTLDSKTVKVLSEDGNWREATISFCGWRQLLKVNIVDQSTGKTFYHIVTPGHSWLNELGEELNPVKTGAMLLAQEGTGPFRVGFLEKDIVPQDNVWCLDEPVTHSFTIASGVVTGDSNR